MTELTPEQASAEAVHKAKNAAQAIELAREAQLAKAIEETVQHTKNAVFEALEKIFGDSDNKDPEQMKILVRRIPILCINMEKQALDIQEIKDNQKWATRAVVGAMISLVVAAVGALIITGINMIF